MLAPWPNRVAGAKYLHEGQKMHLSITEPETGSAIHGLLTDVRFDILLRRASEVHLQGFIPPAEGYPFPLEVVIIYRVGAAFGMAVTLMARYVPQEGDERSLAAAPFGVGFHPYLTVGEAPLKECRLRLLKPARWLRPSPRAKWWTSSRCPGIWTSPAGRCSPVSASITPTRIFRRRGGRRSSPMGPRASASA
ncbi:hypothetical protein [Nesterenkonia pannonica]|uniref:aldose epimerase family protein n=1 Tax=Nesterenkonia pannonica TaxID=1548602 RepID=UPI0021647B9F|nr:hypothetical protein [Nesterenkonia pannonica]